MTRYSYPSTGPIRSRIKRPPPPVNLRWAFAWTFIFATGYSILVLIHSAIRGSTYWPAYHLSTWEIIGLYYAAAVVNGLLLGLLRPLLKWRIGAFVLGTMAGSVIYGAFGLAMVGWNQPVAWIALILGVVIGGILGIVWYDENGPPS
jgi:hypothetical protein